MSELPRYVLRSPRGVIGIAILVTVLGAVAIGPGLRGTNPNDVNTKAVLSPPSSSWPFGTDWLGRDLLSRTLYGGRISILVGFVAVILGMIFGLCVGLAAGYYGGLLSEVLMRVMEVLLAFPPILLALTVVATLGAGLINEIVALGVVYLPIFARVVRSMVLPTKGTEYVFAARAIGAGDIRILMRHILPNVVPLVVVQATVLMGYAVLTEATLSFLGLGAQPPTPTWGSMLSDARQYMFSGAWTSIFPGVAIVFTVVGFNLTGDVVRDALDPRLRVRI